MVTREFDCLSRSTFVNESTPEYTLKMYANYTVIAEQIGQPDPLAPDYVGTYSPPPVYLLQFLTSTEVLS